MAVSHKLTHKVLLHICMSLYICIATYSSYASSLPRYPLCNHASVLTCVCVLCRVVHRSTSVLTSRTTDTHLMIVGILGRGNHAVQQTLLHF